MADLKGLISRWIQKVIVDSVNVILPTDIQARYSETVQTHSGVAVGPSATSYSSFIDCEGFDKVAVTFKTDGSVDFVARVYWSNDGVNYHGLEPDYTMSGTPYGAFIHDVKAKYMVLRMQNADSASPHTVDSWAYLKA